MLLNVKEKFLLRQASIKGAGTLYEQYIKRSGDKPISDASIEYLKAFVQFPIAECLWAIRFHENMHLTKSVWGEEYVYCISLIAAYHLDRKEIAEGLLWAHKAIRLVDYFAPTLDNEIREKVLYNLPASSMVCAFPKQYLQIPCDEFYLDWELKNKRIYFYDNDN